MAQQKMGGVRLFVGIPSYSWQLSIPTVRSLIADLFGLARAGGTFTLFDEAGNTEIGMAREIIVKRFLQSKCTHLLFVDDDVCWQEGGVLRLISHQVALVGGIYPKRAEPAEWPFEVADEPPSPNGLWQANHIPTGFMLISRECVEAMNRVYGDAMFDNIRHETGRYSEDISFCKRWRDIGGIVWADVEITMGHIGPKMFGGTSYMEAWDDKNG